MTDLPIKTATPDFSDVENKIEEYITTLRDHGEVFGFKETIANLVCEAYYPAESGEQFWRWVSEQIKIKEDARAANLAAAEIERKARIKAEVEAWEAARGKTVEEVAREVANVKKEETARERGRTTGLLR